MFKIMFFTGLAFTIVFLILSVILFVKNNVAKLIGDVTGWNAKRAIKKINERGTEEISKTQAIKSEVSKVLIHSADTTKPIHKKLELKPKQSIMAAIHEAQGKSAKEVFKAEEEMIVLAGKEITGTQQKKKITKQGILEGKTKMSEVAVSVPDAESESTGVFSDEAAAVLDEADEATEILAEEVTTVLDEGDEATALLAEEVTTVLGEGDEATALLAEEVTTVLGEGDEATALLAEEMTTVLDEGDEATALLAEEVTTVLGEEDEQTEVLTDNAAVNYRERESSTVVIADETNSILNMAEGVVPILSEEEEFTMLLTGEEKPLPDIFEVEEQATVVHTDESIGEDIAGE